MADEKRRDTVQNMRDKHMAGEMTHDEFYLWLSEFIGIECPESLIVASMNSTDPHLNDIPLSKWDNCDVWVRQFTSGIPWCLSYTVCCLKSLARRAVAQRKANQE